MGALDNCITPAGKRLLSQWLCRPLLHIPDICARQDAVHSLTAPHCAEAVGAARKAFSGTALNSIVMDFNELDGTPPQGNSPSPYCSH